MKKIKHPTINIETIICKCVSTLSNNTKKQILLNIKQNLINKEIDFKANGESGTLHTLKEELTNPKEKMLLIKLYTDKLANRRGACREYYDKIISNNNNICPYCEIHEISTLDHFLPKKKYPSFSITPLNLIPSCATCNKNKLDLSYVTQSDLLFNPYFEYIDNHVWLHARVDFDNNIINFLAKPDTEFDTITAIKIKNTFKRLGLGQLYSIQANIELSSLKYYFNDVFNRGGPNLLKQYLYHIYISNKTRSINYWKTALYKELYLSNEFCSEKFYEFGHY